MRSLLPLPLIALAVLTADLTAQNRRRPQFRASLGAAAGQFDFEYDRSSLDDDTRAGLFQMEFEAVSKRGFGGGVRYEGLTSDDDLFVPNGVLATEARSGTLLIHGTFRFAQHRFEMPVRFGLLLNGLTLEERATGLETSYASLGPYFEIEPHVTLVRRGAFRWSVYSLFGVGAAATSIEIDGDFRDYSSGTAFLGLEAGTRFRFGPAELGVAYVGRFQSMAESDPEFDLVAIGYDQSFNGLLVTFGVVF